MLSEQAADHAPAAAPEIPIHERPIWDRMVAAYDEARKVEIEYDKAVWTPAYEIHVAGGPDIPDGVGAHMERLMDVRDSIETVFMHEPAPTAADALFKLLVALGDGREAFGYLDDILADAERFTGRTGR